MSLTRSGCLCPQLLRSGAVPERGRREGRGRGGGGTGRLQPLQRGHRHRWGGSLQTQRSAGKCANIMNLTLFRQLSRLPRKQWVDVLKCMVWDYKWYNNLSNKSPKRHLPSLPINLLDTELFDVCNVFLQPGCKYLIQLRAEGNDHIERALPQHRAVEVRRKLTGRPHRLHIAEPQLQWTSLYLMEMSKIIFEFMKLYFGYWNYFV